MLPLQHQLFLRDYVARVFEQDEQGVEDFGRERHFAIVFEEKTLVYVNSKAVKQIEASTRPVHHCFQNFLKTISQRIQDSLNTRRARGPYLPQASLPRQT